MHVAAYQQVDRSTRHPYHRPAQGRFGNRAFTGAVENVSDTGAAITLGEAGITVDNGTFVDMHVEGLGHLSGRVARTYDGGFAVQFDEDGVDLDAIADAIRQFDRHA
ncbi:MAG: hypothetical protein CMM77_09500 [Rhodospirillaceae bacterium]|nr:hypothetical protein [Magnetovibrio sp.]MAY67349.1 hypothetical protein [Rhodospirillaceae bacterium]